MAKKQGKYLNKVKNRKRKGGEGEEEKESENRTDGSRVKDEVEDNERIITNKNNEQRTVSNEDLLAFINTDYNKEEIKEFITKGNFINLSLINKKEFVKYLLTTNESEFLILFLNKIGQTNIELDIDEIRYILNNIIEIDDYDVLKILLEEKNINGFNKYTNRPIFEDDFEKFIKKGTLNMIKLLFEKLLNDGKRGKEKIEKIIKKNLKICLYWGKLNIFNYFFNDEKLKLNINNYIDDYIIAVDDTESDLTDQIEDQIENETEKKDIEDRLSLIRFFDRYIISKIFIDKNKENISECNETLQQSTGTCYYNSVLNGIFSSPRLLYIAVKYLNIYRNSLPIDANFDIDISTLTDEQNDYKQKITRNDLLSKNISLIIKTEYRNKTSTESNKFKNIVQKVISSLDKKPVRGQINIIIDPASPNSSLIISRHNADIIIRFFIMKTIYLYLCEIGILKAHLQTQPVPVCSKTIRDYIQLLATLTIIDNTSKSEKYEIAGISKSRVAQIPLYLKSGGIPTTALKQVLKYIYGSDENNKIKTLENVYLNRDIKMNNNSLDPPEILILNFSSMNFNFIEELQDKIIVNGVTYILDHASILIDLTNYSISNSEPDFHAITGTRCKENYIIIDSNYTDKPFNFNWKNLSNFGYRSFLAKIMKTLYQKNFDLSTQNLKYLYVCYVKEALTDYSEKDLISYQCNESDRNIGGNNTHLMYKKKKYKIQKSTKGNYIVVDGKRRYISKGGKVMPSKEKNNTEKK